MGFFTAYISAPEEECLVVLKGNDLDNAPLWHMKLKWFDLWWPLSHLKRHCLQPCLLWPPHLKMWFNAFSFTKVNWSTYITVVHDKANEITLQKPHIWNSINCSNDSRIWSHLCCNRAKFCEKEELKWAFQMFFKWLWDSFFNFIFFSKDKLNNRISLFYAQTLNKSKCPNSQSRFFAFRNYNSDFESHSAEMECF